MTEGAVEVVPGLILGGLDDVSDLIGMRSNVLVPLDRLPGSVWNYGFRGEILYCPIKDRGILPDDVLDDLVKKIVSRLSAKNRVAIFCSGGLGRTGYVAACVLCRLGNKTPIAFLRGNYRYNAVETEDQIEAVYRYCQRHSHSESEQPLRQ